MSNLRIISGVYKITSPSGRVYIGSSKDIHWRFYLYRNLRCEQQHKLYNSFVKYGVTAHTFEIIHECPLDQLFEKETYYGQIYNVLDSLKGLNLRLPKNGDQYSAVSVETLQKMREGMLKSYDKRGRKSKEHHLAKKKEKDSRYYAKRKPSKSQQFENRSLASNVGWDNPDRKVKRTTKEQKKQQKYEYQIAYRAKIKAASPVIPKSVKEAKEYKISEAHREALSVSRITSGIAKGSNNPKAKLNEAQVRVIKSRLANGERQTDIAKEFGVNRGAICDIASGKRWGYV